MFFISFMTYWFRKERVFVLFSNFNLGKMVLKYQKRLNYINQSSNFQIPLPPCAMCKSTTSTVLINDTFKCHTAFSFFQPHPYFLYNVLTFMNNKIEYNTFNTFCFYRLFLKNSYFFIFFIHSFVIFSHVLVFCSKVQVYKEDLAFYPINS